MMRRTQWASYSHTELRRQLTSQCYRVEELLMPGVPWKRIRMVQRWEVEPPSANMTELVATVDKWVAMGIQEGLRKGNLALRMHALLHNAPRSLDHHVNRTWPLPDCAIDRVKQWQNICQRFPLR